MADLNNRSRKILSAIVNEYLSTGEAVGSRTITRRYGVDLSAATVRNVMSDLEEVGLLTQPHTSAGRVPTAQGLRYFVDSLLKVRTLSGKEREEMMGRYQRTDDFETTLRDASRVLADLSAHTVVIVTPRPQTEVLEHLEFMRLRDNQLLAVVVGRSGQVHNKIVTIAQPISQEQLERINNFLHQRLAGRTIEEVCTLVDEELRSERVKVQSLSLMEKQALELSAQALQKGSAGVIIEGQARLLEAVAKSGDPDQMQKLQGLFHALEEKQTLLELLSRTSQAERIQVFIGAETHIEGLSDFTVVATPYGVRDEEGTGEALGMLGVIGPTRMNYSRVINLVELTAEIVNGVIGKR